MIQLSLNFNLDFDRQSDKNVSVKDCWETPEDILSIVSFAFKEGRIVTDPCTSPKNPTKAEVFYTPKQNGLNVAREWKTNAFINPPYSDPSPWLEDIVFRIGFSQIEEAIALVPTGCIHTKRCREWVQNAAAICFWEGRIAFIHPQTGYRAKNTNFVSCFLYYGKEINRFWETFSQYGVVAQVKPYFENEKS